MEITNIYTPIFGIILFFVQSNGLYFNGEDGSHLSYHTWNACSNATLSFEFKTRQENGLLLYIDDGGKYDFIELNLLDGKLRLRINIVDGRDGSVKIILGESLNDGDFHRVEIKRNRMETTLVVDDYSRSAITFGSGSDFEFGSVDTNSDLFFGGLPDIYKIDLHKLSLPSTSFETPFRGSMRNVLVRNCSCQPSRPVVKERNGVELLPLEPCQVNPNVCDEGCYCISTDVGTSCDCSSKYCKGGFGRYIDLISSTKWNPRVIPCYFPISLTLLNCMEYYL